MRGARPRREIELLADYHAKITARTYGYEGDLEDLAKLRIISHPNEHLGLLGSMAEQAHVFLRDRPPCVVELDRPLLFTCDEPVLVVEDDSGDEGHRPECRLTERERRRRRRRAFARGEDEARELVHFVPTRPGGIAVAEEVALPLDPHRLLLLGPRGADGDPHVRLVGDDADEIAAQVTGQVLDQAFLWAAGHPDHPDLRDLDMPEPGPVLRLCDGGSQLSATLNSAPTPRQPTRFRADWT